MSNNQPDPALLVWLGFLYLSSAVTKVSSAIFLLDDIALVLVPRYCEMLNEASPQQVLRQCMGKALLSASADTDLFGRLNAELNGPMNWYSITVHLLIN